MKKIACVALIIGIWFLCAEASPAGAIPGDVNGDKQVDIADAVLSLQIMNQSSTGRTADAGADINKDGRIGMAEVLYILQGVAGQRVLPTIFEVKAATGKITLPAGVPGMPAALTELTVVNPAGEAHPNAQGNFSVDALAGGASLHVVLSPAGNVMLLGWLDADHTSISSRTTAEVMLFFALGGDRYGAQERDNLRWLLAAASEVAPLETAISAQLKSNADAFAGENAAVTAALTGVINTLTASQASSTSTRSISADSGRQAESTSIDPSEKKSGITILPEGVNKIRLTNEYRRRVKVWIDQIAYVPKGGGAWVQSKMPLTEFEIKPVNGLKYTIGVLSDIAAGFASGEQTVYTPVSSEQISLPVMPKSAEKTAYEVVACGLGMADGDIMTLPGSRIASAMGTSASFIFYDLLLPAIVNIVAPQAPVEDLLTKFKMDGGRATVILNTIQSSPGLTEMINQGDIRGAVSAMRDIMVGDSGFQQLVLDGIFELFVKLDGKPPAYALRSEKLISGFLNVMKVLDFALTAADIGVSLAHQQRSKKMESWRVEVSSPKVVLKPEQAIVLPEGTQTFTATVPEATGEAAPSLSYRWKSSNDYGTMTDGIHTGADFNSSQNSVTYTGVSIGTDTIEMEAFEVQGQDRVTVGAGSASIEVASAKVSIEKAVYDVAEGGFIRLKGIVEPAPTADQEIWYSWSSACAFGRFNGGNPFNDKSDGVLYMANASQEGEDVVTLTVYRVVGGWASGTRTALGQAQARVRVWSSPKKAPMTFYTYGPRIVDYSYLAPGTTTPQTRWLIYGWGWSWSTPEGMHRSATPASPVTVNQDVPFYGRYYDEAYKMGLDLKKDMGIPDGVNFEMRLSVRSISAGAEFRDPYGFRDLINERIKRLNTERTAWDSVNVHNVDCVP